MPTDPARTARLRRIRTVLANAGITMLTTDEGRIEIVSTAWLRMMSERILDAVDPTTDAGRVGLGGKDE